MAEEHTAECMSHKDALSWEYEYKCDCGVDDRLEIKQLRALLDKYGGHTDACKSRSSAYYALDPRDRKCDCGWDEAQKVSTREGERMAETTKETPKELKERLWKEHVNPWRGRAGSTIELKIEQVYQLARIADALEAIMEMLTNIK